MFIAYLGKQQVSHKTIKSYLAALRHFHISYGLPFAGLSPRNQLIIKGIRRSQGDSQANRLPITPNILRDIKAFLAAKPFDYDNRMYWAAMTLGFFGFLRCGEFTIPDAAIFDSSVHLSIDDIEFDSIESPSSLSVCIKASKTDPFRQGITIYLGKTDAAICPVMAMADYLSIRGSLPGPLFHSQQGEPLRRKKLVEIMRGALAAKGYDTSQYCGTVFALELLQQRLRMGFRIMLSNCWGDGKVHLISCTYVHLGLNFWPIPRAWHINWYGLASPYSL